MNGFNHYYAEHRRNSDIHGLSRLVSVESIRDRTPKPRQISEFEMNRKRVKIK